MLEHIGPRIRRERKRGELTLDELSARASVSTSYLSRLERGEIESPGFEELKRIAQTFGMTVSQLSGEEPVEEDTSPALREAMHVLRQVQEEPQRWTAVDMLRALVTLTSVAQSPSGNTPQSPRGTGTKRGKAEAWHAQIPKPSETVYSRVAVSVG